MPYIGNTVQTQGFAPAIDYFSGNGVTVTFTLSRPVLSVAQLTVAVDNVIQNPSSAFNVSGNSITFTSAPLSGTNNIWVEYTSLITTYAAISQDPSVIGDITATGGFLAEGDFGNTYIDGTIVDYVTGNARITTGPIDDMTFYHGGTSSRSEMMTLYYAGGAKIYGTTALTLPTGTTGERPGTPANGMIRYNTTNSEMEVYVNGSWKAVTTQITGAYAVNYLIVAGGGGGGSSGSGGGGGAGGLLSGSTSLLPGSTYSVSVGAGGTAGAYSSTIPTNGGDSSFASLTAIGGGRGGYWDIGNGGNGGSGGGGGGGSATTGGAATVGQGNAGGSATGAANYGSGGGGGAGAVGGNGNGSAGAAGGVGSVTTLITTAQATSASVGQVVSSSVYFAGGGGGGIYYAAGGLGGSGGGGNANAGSGQAGSAGGTNTGGGGGGGGSNGSNLPAGGAGGSGCVIISVPTAKYTGTTTGSPTVVTNGSNTVMIFKSSGTYTA